MKRRLQELESSIARYLAQLDSADQEDAAIAEAKTERLKEKIAALKEQMRGAHGTGARKCSPHPSTSSPSPTPMPVR